MHLSSYSALISHLLLPSNLETLPLHFHSAPHYYTICHPVLPFLSVQDFPITLPLKKNCA